MLHNAHPKRNTGSAKRGKPSEVKSFTSNFAPLLATTIIFRRIASHDRYKKKRSSFANGRKQTGQGSEEMRGGI